MSIFSFGKKPVEQLIKEGAKTEAEFKQLVEEACSRGAVHAKLFLDAHAPEKKVAEDALVNAVSQMTKEKGVLFCKGEIEQSVESNGMYSSFSTIEIITTSLNVLINLSMKYAPTGFEIIEPRELKVSVKEVQEILLDVSQQAQIYSHFILENSMNEAQKVDFAERLRRKVERGTELRQKAEDKLNKSASEGSKVA